MEIEAGLLEHFVGGVVFELPQQFLHNLSFLLGDDTGVVGLISQSVVEVERVCRARKGQTVGALHTLYGCWTIASSVVLGYLFGTVVKRVMMTGRK